MITLPTMFATQGVGRAEPNQKIDSAETAQDVNPATEPDQDFNPTSEPTQDAGPAEPTPPPGSAFEVNALWPFFPGGLVDLKVVTPIAFKSSAYRGELITGLHSDFGWRSIRDDEDNGRVAFLGAKLGYRQFFGHGIHAESAMNIGWRHEKDHPLDGKDVHALQIRLWSFAGYQHEFSRWVYANARAGFGLHIYRSDRFADRERTFVPAGDLNLGFRFR